MPDTATCPCWSKLTPAKQQRAIAIATTWLWGATGRRYGLCEVTVRPCQPKRGDPAIYRTYPVIAGYGDGRGLASPYIDVGGQWRNCGCGAGCCCRPDCEVELRGPVAGITEVRVDGAVVDPSEYRVDYARGAYWLVKTSAGCWPSCQDFNANSGEGTFFVTYDRGITPPIALLDAAEVLACEFAKAFTGDGKCRLPNRVQSITRQGIEVQMGPPEIEDFASSIGIPEIDNLVASMNPSRLRSRPQVLSPDLPTVGDRITVVP